MSFGGIVKRLFIPHKCVACRQIHSYKNYEDTFCPECRLAYNVAKTESCEKCGAAAFECSCQPTLLAKSGSLCLSKLFFYHKDKQNEAQNKLIYHLKHNNTQIIAAFAAKELWSVLQREMSNLGADGNLNECVIVNMPRKRSAVIKYGYDQSAEICKELSKVSGIEYRPVLRRRLGGKEQKKLDGKERKSNMKNVIFAARNACEFVKDRYVILVDDVVTSGASMAECIRVLRKMGTRGVICAALSSDMNNMGRR